jgi:hypothetical protein
MMERSKALRSARCAAERLRLGKAGRGVLGLEDGKRALVL